MKRKLIYICAIWSCLTAALFIWNYKSAVNEQYNLSIQTARSFFQQILLFRSWNAGHGGVYVPVTADTQPNPYLEDPARDIKVNKNLTLTKINPAFMTRQVSELAMKKDGVRFHITSLKPIRPGNRPTPAEETVLKEFESGITEKGVVTAGSAGDSFFYMGALTTEKRCLNCHAKQGYKEGEIRGGISITIPFIQKVPVFRLVMLHMFLLIGGLSGLIFSGIKLSKAYNTIKRQAVFDALTGIPNRHSFSERILTEFNRSLRDKFPLSVIMGDIDHFKLYNDTYGHAEGDECLKNVARAIEKTLKRPGDFCARYGGEEFIIILPSTNQDGAAKIAEDIRVNVLSLKIPHRENHPAEFVTISLGTATKEPGKIPTYEELLKMADEALYIAKKRGRNRVETFS